VKKVLDQVSLLRLAHRSDAAVGYSNLLGALELGTTLGIKTDHCEVLVDFEHGLEVFRLELRRQVASKKHGCLLGCLVHTEHAFNLTRFVVGILQCLKRLFCVEGGVQIAVADGVAHRDQALLTFLLNHLVTDV
jgi:hypothetical protein